MPNTLQRTVFSTSRLAEFCSKDELCGRPGTTSLTGRWSSLKELVDNALDAAEEAGIAPVIKVTFDDTGITVTDNGPGIAPDAVASILDYSNRTSSREAYVSPTRGAQGNALADHPRHGSRHRRRRQDGHRKPGRRPYITFAIDRSSASR